MVEELKTLRDVIARFEALKISYMVTGSMAMTYYAVPRMTRDIDFVVEVRSQDVERLVRAFKNDYYIDEDMIEAIEHRKMFNLIHNETALKIDCIIYKEESEYELIKFNRKKLKDLGGFKGFLISPEDLILSKLLWAKDSVSELQLKDIENILSSSKDLNTDYISEWAKKLNVIKLLQNFTSFLSKGEDK